LGVAPVGPIVGRILLSSSSSVVLRSDPLSVGRVVIVVDVNVGDLVIVPVGEGGSVGGTAVGGTVAVAVAKGDAVGSGVAIVGPMVGDNDVGCMVGRMVGDDDVGGMVGLGTAMTAVGDTVLGAVVGIVVGIVVVGIVVLSHRQSPRMANTICSVASAVETCRQDKNRLDPVAGGSMSCTAYTPGGCTREYKNDGVVKSRGHVVIVVVVVVVVVGGGGDGVGAHAPSDVHPLCQMATRPKSFVVSLPFGSSSPSSLIQVAE